MKAVAINPQWVLYGVAAGVGLIVLNQLMRGRVVASAASSVAQLPIDLFLGGAEGLFGLPDPRTDASKSKCAAALAVGDCWSASFACPAADYLRCMKQKYL